MNKHLHVNHATNANEQQSSAVSVVDLSQNKEAYEFWIERRKEFEALEVRDFGFFCTNKLCF